jgi:hypothetical protein
MCASCGAESDCHTGTSDKKPVDGDISLCVKCGAVNVYKIVGEVYMLEKPPEGFIDTLDETTKTSIRMYQRVIQIKGLVR